MPPIRPNRMAMTNEKADFKSLKKLFLYCKVYLPAIIVALCLAVISAVISIIGPNKIEDLINLITEGIKNIEGIDISGFIEVFIFLIIIYVIGAVANYFQQFIMAIVTQKTSKKLRTNIDIKINKLPLKYFDNTTRGDILSRVTNDVDTISQTLGSTIANLVNALALFLGTIVMMFYISPILALVTIGASIIGFSLMFIILRFSQKYFNKKQVNLGEMNGHIEEIYTNHNVVKAYNGEDTARQKFASINNELYQNNYKSQFLSGLMHPIMNFSGNLSYVAIFVVGVALILNGNSHIGFGTISAFIIYARLFSQPLTNFAQSLASLQQASAASKRVFEMLDSEELDDESRKNAKLDKVLGNVEFKNVKFGYNDTLIIKDFSASLKAGQKVAIVGPTGAGKTTLVNLLMRFYEVNSGEILIDEISTKEMKREDVHDLFDMILQDTWLFNGTVKENLIYNKEDVSLEMLDKVCQAVGLTHFIKTLPNGYDTILDETITISEGQKQQLTIARAMIKDSPLLILDEATSSVDTRTELVIQEAMDKLTENRTSFIIAHRLSTIKNADIILVMNNGDIIEQGTHDQLLAKKGFYAELYNSQFAIVS